MPNIQPAIDGRSLAVRSAAVLPDAWKARLKPGVALFVKSAILRGLLNRIAGTPGGFRWLNRMAGTSGVFRSFCDAQKAVAHLGLRGHDEPAQSDFYSHLFRQSDYPVLYWLGRIKPRRLFDFGGALGGLYELYRDYLDPDYLHAPDSIDWIVYDLPEVIERGRERAARHPLPHVRFTSDLSDGNGADLFLASGSLHYWEDSLNRLFAGFKELPKHVVINRSPVTDRETYVIVQRFPGVAIPSVIRNRAALVNEFEQLGYELSGQWIEPTRELALPLFPGYDIKAYTGFYFRLR